jgi:hypothetical protein
VADRLGENGVTLEYLTGPGAGLGAADPAYLDWFMRYTPAGASPAAFAALELWMAVRSRVKMAANGDCG